MAQKWVLRVECLLLITLLSRKNYQTEQTYVTGSVGMSAMPPVNGYIAINCQLRLGKIPFSIFNVDRDLFTTEALQLLVEWEA